MRLLGLVAGLTMTLVLPVNALTLPDKGELRFDVIRKGKDIGDHSYSFSGSPDAFTVKVSTDVQVKVPLIRINAYNFQHNSTETWARGKLQKLSSTTNDDGEPHQLTAQGKGVLPASLWNEDTVRSDTLLNTVDGKIMAVHVADLGAENVAVRSGNVQAHHYRVSGALQRDLWYDETGNLARVTFKAEDGSTVTYIRK